MTTHANAQLIERLFMALDRHDATAMAACYRDDAVLFHDIAFDIDDKPRLVGMWRMVCEGESDIRVTIKNITADDQSGEAHIVDRYVFGRNSRRRSGRLINHSSCRSASQRRLESSGLSCVMLIAARLRPIE